MRSGSSSLLHLLFFLSLPWLLLSSSSSSDHFPQQYIVYMGSSSSTPNGEGGANELAEPAYLQLLSSVIPSSEKERISIIHHYNHAFKGFSAMLTKSEAALLHGGDGVVSIFPDPMLQLHTTRSWEFLEAQSRMIGSPHELPHAAASSDDVIVGMIDTGIWPESHSFNDEGIGEIPSRWKGICMEGPDFTKLNCNRKLIGARYYGTNGRLIDAEERNPIGKLEGSPRDHDGHGTHTASIVGGARVVNASYNGLARGTARGGSPSSRIAVYKACTGDGCSGSIILKAIDDAIKDGVDIISISIGMSSLLGSEYLNDPIGIGAFHAQQKGVLVVCSGGNDGPAPYTIVNSAPWIFTVAASTIDRSFDSAVVLGNGKIFQGSAINFSNLTRSTTYPLVFGGDAATNFTPISEASICYPGSLERHKVAGKLVVCMDNGFVSRQIQILVAEDAKAKGLILVDEAQKGVPSDSGSFPFSEIGNLEGQQILSYITNSKKATATILPTIGVARYKPAPVVAYFSSRGPGQPTENIIKPDVMAPGVAILAAMIPDSKVRGGAPTTNKQARYAIKSGTSMACPHVAGAAALIKSVHRNWSPSMIRSALMTTTNIYDNMRKPLTNSSHSFASPHEMGAGEIDPLKALNPGLVFETTNEDYLLFLCYTGAPEKSIKFMSNTKFNCPRIRADKLISNINYPSISISKLSRHQADQSIKRTVTNLGTPNSTYIANVHAPLGLVVRVLPKKITFTERLESISFKILFNGKNASSGYNFGYVTWFDDVQHSVRLVFGVNVE